MKHFEELIQNSRKEGIATGVLIVLIPTILLLAYFFLNYEVCSILK